MTVKLVCQTGRTEGERIAAVIAEAVDGVGAVTLLETRGGWRIEAYFETPPDMDAVRAVLSPLPGAADLAFAVEPIPEEDWVSMAQRGLPPVVAGDFVVYGSHARDARRRRRHGIEIEAGRAFGTAHHGTTQGCLRAISDLARAGFAPRSALDMGTGSGVLAIAIAKSMGTSVLAADIDPVAVAVACANVRINGVGARVRTVLASRMEHASIAAAGPFDLIAANILAGPLVELALGMRKVTRPGGAVILSGLLERQAAEVWGKYRAVGFDLRGVRSLEGWTTLVLARR
ncbi:MAG: 50S ribosomal protein L11 methyltransferase [Hyphomicrobiales bacterium]|nr:50S ribosomal protein L11 methyltransferase [Hyphomicrobiales bacterium]